MRTKTAFIFWLLTISSCLFAQGLVNVRHYSAEDGLSQNTIQSIIQDDEGYIWLATWNGLEKFDGYSFKNFKSYPSDTIRLRNNRLIHIVNGGKQLIWCQSYDDKIYLFNSQYESFDNVSTYHPKIKACYDVKQMIALDNGILWVIGNDSGLWRIDGYHYKEEKGMLYYPPHSSPQHGEHIYAICMDTQGNEWILTNHGYFVHGNKSLSGNKVFRFYAQTEKESFMLTLNGELAMYDSHQRKLKEIALPEVITDICGLFSIQNRQLCIATCQGLIIYQTDTQQYKKILFPKKEGTIHPERFYQTQNGMLCMFDGKNNVIFCDAEKGTVRFVNYPTFNTSRPNRHFIHEDANGFLWILPKYGDLCYYNPKEDCFQQAYTYAEDNESSNYLYYKSGNKEHLIDSHKNLWICRETGFDKVTFLNGNSHHLSTNNDTETRGLFIDSRKRIWAGNKKGIVEIYDTTQNFIGNLDASGRITKDRKAIFGANIYCFFEDEKQRIWMGSKEDGLYIACPDGNEYQISRYQHHPNDKNSLGSNSVYSILEDNHGHIWIGTYGGGLNLVSGEFPKLEFIHPLDSTSRQLYSNIRSIHCTTNGTIMAGSTEGLITFSSSFQSPDEIQFYYNHCEEKRTESLANNDVLSIFETKKGKIYVTTYSGGISRIESTNLLSDKIQFSHLNRKNGLPSDIAHAMLEDKEGNLWISFETCLCKYDTKEQTFETYDRFNLNTRLKISETPPVIDDRQTMYIGTTNGTLYIQLEQLQKSDFVPPIVFTNVSIQKDNNLSKEKPVIENTLVLEKDERNATISFAALDFTNVENLQYAYRIKDLSDEWIYIEKNHSASFVNLPSGNLILEVKSTNGDGVWTENTAELTMHILPTFWETGWAWCIYIIGIALLILGVSSILAYIFNLQRKVDFEQQLTNLKLRFFTDISHELRTPLTLIAVPVEEVLEKEKLTPEGHDNMMIAKQNIDRMLRLINQLLDFRKIQHNKMKLYIEQTDAITLLRHTFDNFTNLAHQRHIDFRFTSTSDILLIYTDADKLEKILFNLLSNAFKYTPDGKSIRLSVEGDNDWLKFKVTDEGNGFDLQKVDQLFSRFDTLGKQPQPNSSGIGLSFVSELLQLMHGAIQADSTIGQGSQFTVTLPTHYEAFAKDENVELILNDGKENENRETTTSPNEFQPDTDFTVLVVEDNAELRHLIASILQNQYQVTEAADGMEGFEKIKSTLPDLIISDIMMPRMDGIELLEKVRNDHDVSHIPFILLSAKSTLEDRISGLEYGADDYITKPFSGGYLKARIASMLKQRNALKTYFTEGRERNKKPEASAKNKTPKLPLPSPAITRFDEDFTKKIIQSVEEHMNDPEFKIDDLADTLNLSRTVFYRKIKSILGISPKDLVKDMRIKKAVQLMKSGHYSISEVGYMIGFSSPQYFSRVFKEVMNCTPSEYMADDTRNE